MAITSQKLYGVLRAAGWGSKSSSTRWPVVRKDEKSFTITYESYEGERSIPRELRERAIGQMREALDRAGITAQECGTLLIIDLGT